MKLGRYFIAFGLSLIIFSGFLITENSYYQIQKEVQDPFAQAVEINQISSSPSSPTPYFTTQGEFFRVFPETQTDFTSSSKELVEGEIYWSADLIDPQNQKNEFSFSNTPQVGQLMVGPLLINAPNASLFVSKKGDNITLFALNHSVEVLWREANHPFLIPSGSKVTLNQKILTGKISTLFYSKLKKEFRLKPFQLDLLPSELKRKITASQSILKDWKSQLKSFANQEPKTWITPPPNQILGSLIQNIQALALVPTSMKQEIQFNRLVSPFVIAHYDILESNGTKAPALLETFGNNQQSSQWKTLMSQNTALKNKWERFEKAHKSHLQSISSDDKEYLFTALYNQASGTSRLDLFNRQFAEIETLIANDQRQEANKQIQKLVTTLNELSLQSQDQKEITSARRLSKELLTNNKYLQNPEAFTLYTLLVEKEAQIKEEQTELGDEITLEVAQEILEFMNTFLVQNPDPTITKKLFPLFTSLDIENIAQKLGRTDIFTPEQTEFIAYISLAGSSGLTKEDIQSIKKQKAYQQEITQEIQKLKAQSEAPVEESFSEKISDTESLVRALKKMGIDVSVMKTFSSKNNQFLVFKQGKIGSGVISGKFFTPKQEFPLITINNKSHKTVPKNITIVEEGKEVEKEINRPIQMRDLKQLLFSFKKELQASEEESEDFIPQNTKKAILERTLVRESLANAGFELSRNDVELADRKYEQFLITNGLYKSKLQFEASYTKSTNSLTRLTINYGRKKFRYGNESFSLESLPEVFEAKLNEVEGMP